MWVSAGLYRVFFLCLFIAYRMARNDGYIELRLGDHFFFFGCEQFAYAVISSEDEFSLQLVDCPVQRVSPVRQDVGFEAIEMLYTKFGAGDIITIRKDGKPWTIIRTHRLTLCGISPILDEPGKYRIQLCYGAFATWVSLWLGDDNRDRMLDAFRHFMQSNTTLAVPCIVCQRKHVRDNSMTWWDEVNTMQVVCKDCIRDSALAFYSWNQYSGMREAMDCIEEKKKRKRRIVVVTSAKPPPEV